MDYLVRHYELSNSITMPEVPAQLNIYFMCSRARAAVIEAQSEVRQNGPDGYYDIWLNRIKAEMVRLYPSQLTRSIISAKSNVGSIRNPPRLHNNGWEVPSHRTLPQAAPCCYLCCTEHQRFEVGFDEIGSRVRPDGSNWCSREIYRSLVDHSRGEY